MRAAHITRGLRQPPVPGQGQPLRGLSQSHFLADAFAAAAADQYGLQHGLAGHQGAGHVGKQTGGQGGAMHQTGFGLIGQVVARHIGQRACAAYDANQ